jgi:hypothetical protein
MNTADAGERGTATKSLQEFQDVLREGPVELTRAVHGLQQCIIVLEIVGCMLLYPLRLLCVVAEPSTAQLKML